MTRIIVGFIIGVVISRNSAAMPHPVFASVILAFLIGGYLMYRFGKRDVNVAVATAVAVANADAAAAADASAKAAANAAVNLVLMQQPGSIGYGSPITLDREYRESIVEESLRSLDHDESHNMVSQITTNKRKVRESCEGEDSYSL